MPLSRSELAFQLKQAHPELRPFSNDEIVDGVLQRRPDLAGQVIDDREPPSPTRPVTPNPFDQPPEPQPTFGSRFKESVPPIWDLPEGVKAMVTDPRLSASLLAELPGNMKGAIESEARKTIKSWDDLERAVSMAEADRAGGKLIAHGLGTFTAPFGGAQAANVVEDTLAGNYSAAVGGAAGLALPMLVGGRGKVTPAAKSRIPLTMGERSGGKVTGIIEAAAERSFPGAPVFSRFRGKQQQAIQDAFQELRGDVSPYKGTAESVGNRTKAALAQTKDGLTAEERVVYDAIDQAVEGDRVPEMASKPVPTGILDEHGAPLTREAQVPTGRTVMKDGVNVNTVPLKAAAWPLLLKLQEQSSLISPDLMSRVRGQLQTIMDSPKEVPFSAAAGARSTLLQISRQLDELPGLRSRTGGITATVTKALDESMDSAATQSGKTVTVPGESPVPLNDAVTLARGMTRAKHAAFDSPFIQGIMRSTRPEQIVDQVARAGIQEIRDLRRLMPADQFNEISSQILQGVLEKSTTGELSVTSAAGDLISNSSPAAKPRFKGGAFGRQLEDLGTEKLKLLFPGHYHELINLLQETQRVGMHGRSSLLGSFYNAFVLSSGYTGKLPAAAGSSAMIYGLSHVLTKPEGLTALRNFVRSAEASPHAPATLYWAQQVTRLSGMDQGQEPQQDESASQRAISR